MISEMKLSKYIYSLICILLIYIYICAVYHFSSERVFCSYTCKLNSNIYQIWSIVFARKTSQKPDFNQLSSISSKCIKADSSCKSSLVFKQTNKKCIYSTAVNLCLRFVILRWTWWNWTHRQQNIQILS